MALLCTVAWIKCPLLKEEINFPLLPALIRSTSFLRTEEKWKPRDEAAMAGQINSIPGNEPIQKIVVLVQFQKNVRKRGIWEAGKNLRESASRITTVIIA